MFNRDYFNSKSEQSAFNEWRESVERAVPFDVKFSVAFDLWADGQSADNAAIALSWAESEWEKEMEKASAETQGHVNFGATPAEGDLRLLLV